MTRPLRPNIAGATYHVMARGNERQALFLDDADHRLFLRMLQAVVCRMRWNCLAYCLMGNHYHLVVQTPLPNLSRGMRSLNGGYATEFNRRYNRVGHLFQGRFRSVLVRDPAHLLMVLKYVIRNPVTAGMCGEPEQWPWSSYRRTVNGAGDSDILAQAAVLEWFGGDGDAPARFAAFMKDDGAPLDPPTDSVELAGSPCEPVPDCPLEELLAAHPGIAGVALAYDRGHSLRRIAAMLGRSKSGLGRELAAYESARMLDSAT